MKVTESPPKINLSTDAELRRQISDHLKNVDRCIAEAQQALISVRNLVHAADLWELLKTVPPAQGGES